MMMKEPCSSLAAHSASDDIWLSEAYRRKGKASIWAQTALMSAVEMACAKCASVNTGMIDPALEQTL